MVATGVDPSVELDGGADVFLTKLTTGVCTFEFHGVSELDSGFNGFRIQRDSGFSSPLTSQARSGKSSKIQVAVLVGVTALPGPGSRKNPAKAVTPTLAEHHLRHCISGGSKMPSSTKSLAGTRVQQHRRNESDHWSAHSKECQRILNPSESESKK
jgi:hypothetical protein